MNLFNFVPLLRKIMQLIRNLKSTYVVSKLYTCDTTYNCDFFIGETGSMSNLNIGYKL